MKGTEARLLTPAAQYALGALSVLVLAALLWGAAWMPFVYESQSIRYKLGIDKTLLRAGKTIAMIAAVLLLLQLCLSARLKVLDRVFSLNRLYHIHRVNALVICALAVLHPLFVFGPEDITSLSPEREFWPEVLGAFLLMLIVLITATGLWRAFLRLPFHRWWLFHRFTVFLAAAALYLHVLNVSDSFEAGFPRALALTSAGLYLLLFTWVKIKTVLRRQKPFEVTAVHKAGRDAVSIDMTPGGEGTFQYAPGQFAFFTFLSPHVSSEEHPFSLASPPGRSRSLQVSIRCCGDWTRKAGFLRPGDRVFVDGPYGRFSHLRCRDNEEIIMIAGGIGITPMMSMLRHMAERGETRRVSLIWSNRSKEDILDADEVADLEIRLREFTVTHVITREDRVPGLCRKVNEECLAALLERCSRKAHVFLCGPAGMMREVGSALTNLGFMRRRIYTEEFRL